jgi:hypothetical protein
MGIVGPGAADGLATITILLVLARRTDWWGYPASKLPTG